MLPHSERGGLTSNRSVFTIKLSEKIYDGLYLQKLSSLEALHLDESGLNHACFPKKFRITTFWDISEQLFQLFNQINF